jgi:hypothetical protein
MRGNKRSVSFETVPMVSDTDTSMADGHIYDE